MFIDPFDAATTAGEFAGVFYGKLEVTAQFVVLERGVGKSVFDDQKHDEKDRRTEISILLNPIDAMNMTMHIDRQIIAESAEWSRHVWPSARDLGVSNARELNGRYVRAEMVKTGRTWNDKKSGEKREGTTFKFTAFFESLEACEEAYFADLGVSPTESDKAGSDDIAELEKQTAEQFLPALVKQADGDRGKLAELIANMPIISKHFTVDSPEVQALMVGA